MSLPWISAGAASPLPAGHVLILPKQAGNQRAYRKDVDPVVQRLVRAPPGGTGLRVVVPHDQRHQVLQLVRPAACTWAVHTERESEYSATDRLCPSSPLLSSNPMQVQGLSIHTFLLNKHPPHPI